MNTRYLLLKVGLVHCYPVCRLLPAFVNRGFPTAVAPPLPSPLERHPYNGCVALPTHFAASIPNTKERKNEHLQCKQIPGTWYMNTYCSQNKWKLIGKTRKNWEQRRKPITTKRSKIIRGVGASLSCPPGGAATDLTTNKGKKSKTGRKNSQEITKHREEQARHPPSLAGLLSYHKNKNEREK